MWRVGVRHHCMRPVEDRFRGHLVEDESVQALTSGRLLESGRRGRMTIGLTDRRLLCVGDAGGFVDVGYDYVSSIRSRQRTTVRYRPGPEPNRTLHLLGGLLGLLALVGVVVAASSVTAFGGVATTALAAATVVVAAPTEAIRRRSSIGRSFDEILVGVGALSVLVFLAIAVVDATVSLPLYALATLGGLALTGYAVRYREAIEPSLDGLGLERDPETVITLTTVDGTELTIAVGADSTFDRDLGTRVRDRDHTPLPAETAVVRTPSD